MSTKTCLRLICYLLPNRYIIVSLELTSLIDDVMSNVQMVIRSLYVSGQGIHIEVSTNIWI